MKQNKYRFIGLSIIILTVILFLFISIKYVNTGKNNATDPKAVTSKNESKTDVKLDAYNIYYGQLHNHSNISDGKGTPTQAYKYARDNGKLDFFSLADHDGGFNDKEWDGLKQVANQYNEDGKFVTFWGFEWTSSGKYGHVTVINTQDMTSASNSKSNTFEKLVEWLSKREGIAFFNHPGRENSSGKEFEHFNTTPSDKFVGMELWNKNDAFKAYYYNNGYDKYDQNKSYYDEASSKGWKAGAAGSGDNHKASWGTDNDYRLAVLAKEKTRNSIYDALENRRFFSTLDSNLGLSFKLNDLQMGSTVKKGTYYAEIKAGDGDGEVFTKIILYRNGKELYKWSQNTSAPIIKQNIKTETGEYYYVK